MSAVTLRRDEVLCPAESEGCEKILALRAGEITAHLVDDHDWQRVAAQAAENLARREALGAPAPKTRTATSRRGEPHHCSVCRHPGTRRDKCPNRANHPGAAVARAALAAPAVDDAAVAELTEAADDRPLFRVGSAIDTLREISKWADSVADELDALVADGLIP